jgi:hypothetical protein
VRWTSVPHIVWVLLTNARNELPVLPPEDSGIRRGGKFTLTATGTLSGEVVDLHYGAYASFERNTYR